MGQQVLLTGVGPRGPACRGGRRGHLPGVDVHAVLALLGEADGQGHNVAHRLLAHKLGQLLLLQPVLVQRGHEVGEGAGHLELDLEALAGKDERVLVGERYEAEEAGGLGRSPLPGGAVRQRHHHRLQVRADDLELADRLELHRLAGEILLRRDGVGEDVEKELAGAGRVHAKGHGVAHHRLKKKNIYCSEIKLIIYCVA